MKRLAKLKCRFFFSVLVSCYFWDSVECAVERIRQRLTLLRFRFALYDVLILSFTDSNIFKNEFLVHPTSFTFSWSSCIPFYGFLTPSLVLGYVRFLRRWEPNLWKRKYLFWFEFIQHSQTTVRAVREGNKINKTLIVFLFRFFIFSAHSLQTIFGLDLAMLNGSRFFHQFKKHKHRGVRCCERDTFRYKISFEFPININIHQTQACHYVSSKRFFFDLYNEKSSDGKGRSGISQRRSK